uniref:Sushi domain-containing protein n=1 Tax=Picea sitchensis TaxID=3332 RepID=A9NXX8_PICSI|nr:unknown [Picea sitchensis]
MPDPSVNYYCKVTGDGIVSGTRACHELEPHGTEVVPECNRPVYYSSSVPLNMRCVDGSWDHVAVCQPAAHCFWKTEHQAAASTYAVALGTVYRPWDEAMDSEAHKSDVSEIKIPFRYLGDAGHHQEDIALVFMSTPVVYHTYIRPVCIDFSDEFDRNQLQSTNSGKVRMSEFSSQATKCYKSTDGL